MANADAPSVATSEMRRGLDVERLVIDGRSLGLLWGTVVLPSLAPVLKFGGAWCLCGYLCATVAAMLVARAMLPALSLRLTPVRAWASFIAVLAVLVAIVFVLYPIANTHAPRRGSDSDDALDQATRAFVHGLFPYREHTYLGNPLSPLPGGLVLAAPFVMLFGKSAYGNILWLLLFAAHLRRVRGETATLLALISIVALSIGYDHALAIGSDYVANGIAVCLAAAMLVETVERRGATPWLAAVFLGVAFAWRANFLLIVPILVAVLARRAGSRRALALLATSGFVTAALVIPMWAHDPAHFSPLHTANKLSDVGGLVPHPVVVLIAANALLAFYLASAASDGELSTMMRDCTVVLAFPVVAVVALRSVAARHLQFDYAPFGSLVVPFGTMAAWLRAQGAPSR